MIIQYNILTVKIINEENVTYGKYSGTSPTHGEIFQEPKISSKSNLRTDALK